MTEQNNDQILNQIAEEIRRAREAGKIAQAAHFAGVARQLIDPNAPPPPKVDSK